MKFLPFLLLLCFLNCQGLFAQGINFPVANSRQFNSSSSPEVDSRYNITLNTKVIRNAALRGALLQATSYGAFMWLTDENVWLSAGLSVATVMLYSIVDDPNNWDAHIGHVGSAAILSISISIPLKHKKSKMPWRILNN